MRCRCAGVGQGSRAVAVIQCGVDSDELPRDLEDADQLALCPRVGA